MAQEDESCLPEREREKHAWLSVSILGLMSTPQESEGLWALVCIKAIIPWVFCYCASWQPNPEVA